MTDDTSGDSLLDVAGIQHRAAAYAHEKHEPWHSDLEDYGVLAAHYDVPALLAEVERLCAENAALCVAATAVLYPTTAGVFHCYHCRAYVLDATDHAPDCPFTTLRELVEQGKETT